MTSDVLNKKIKKVDKRYNLKFTNIESQKKKKKKKNPGYG